MKRIPLVLAAFFFILFMACGNIASPSTPTAPAKTSTVEPTQPASATATPSPVPVEPADVIFTDGNILTMDPADPNGHAIAIRGREILAIGSKEEIMKLHGENTVLVSLDGRTLMPGFVDAHSHLFGEQLLIDQDPLPNQQMAMEQGVTTTSEMGVDQAILNKFKAIADAGKLRMRVNAYLLSTTNCGDPVGDWWKGYQPNQQIAPNLYVRGIKIFADGGSCKAPGNERGISGRGKRRPVLYTGANEPDRRRRAVRGLSGCHSRCG